MARRAATGKKTVSAANLAALGSERLAALLMEAAAGDANLKRRLRMELAAELGAADLAFEIDKRLTSLAGSRSRVSWRKRPALLGDLVAVRRIILERLAPLDVRLGLDRLIAWFDLYPGLVRRVSDARGELPAMFEAATADLAALASQAGPDIAGETLGEALSTRLDPWATWVGGAAQVLDPAVARRLLADLTHGRPRPTGRLAVVVRRLAERAGDLDAWIATIPDDERRRPATQVEVARRLATAGRPAEARAALDSARSGAKAGSAWLRRAEAPTLPDPAWLEAEIAVLDAEGQTAEADAARWGLFEQTLSPDPLRTVISHLADFEDVVALDRAFALAAAHPDAMKALSFLMDWPALREAAALIETRGEELRGAHEDAPLWVSRLAGRYPLAALRLLRTRIRSLVLLGAADREIEGLLGEAEGLAAGVELPEGMPDHPTFAAGLRRSSAMRTRRR